MSIKTFLKKILSPPKPEPIIKETEYVKTPELPNWIKQKKKSHLQNETKILEPIKQRITEFQSELKTKIEIFENIDLADRKVEPRVRSIVKGNVDTYTNHLQKMIDKLGTINKREGIIKEINEIFNTFNAKTHISSQKISFLLPKEITAVRNAMAIFLKDLEAIFKSNKEDFEEFIVIQSVEKMIDEHTTLKEHKENLLEVINKDSKILEKSKQDLINQKKKIKALEESDKFKAEIEKKNNLESRKKKLEKDIYNLKTLIDFKGLSFFYHSFDKEMKLIKEYKENFKQNFQSMNTENLTNLLEGANLNNDKITKLIEKIKQDEKEIKDTKIDDFGIDKIKHQIDNLNKEIALTESRDEAKTRKLEEYNTELKESLDKIKSELEKLHVSLK